MNTIAGSTPLPEGVSASTAWSAFDHIVHRTDWRPRIRTLKPIRLWIEGDDAFQHARSLATSWKSGDQALAWVSARIEEAAARVDPTTVRRMNLQQPASIDEPYAEAFLDGLRTRIQRTVRSEIQDHFDTSLAEWEADALRFTDTIEDIVEHRKFSADVGLDQIVSEDACRKALKFLHHRTHWHITDGDTVPVLNPDHRFRNILTRRHSHVETARARDLVARAIEAVIRNHIDHQLAGAELNALTKGGIMTVLEHRFRTDGVWGLIHTVLKHDRKLREGQGEGYDEGVGGALIQRQAPWLHAAQTGPV